MDGRYIKNLESRSVASSSSSENKINVNNLIQAYEEEKQIRTNLEKFIHTKKRNTKIHEELENLKQQNQ